jgi:hypothetical protein
MAFVLFLLMTCCGQATNGPASNVIDIQTAIYGKWDDMSKTNTTDVFLRYEFMKVKKGEHHGDWGIRWIRKKDQKVIGNVFGSYRFPDNSTMKMKSGTGLMEMYHIEFKSRNELVLTRIDGGDKTPITMKRFRGIDWLIDWKEVGPILLILFIATGILVAVILAVKIIIISRNLPAKPDSVRHKDDF